MWKSRLYLLIAICGMFSLSVSASDVGERSYAEPVYAMYAGYSGSEVTESGFNTVAEIAYLAIDMSVPLIGTIIENLDKLKPDKQMRLYYAVLKPTNLAKKQNQNFDRVSTNYTF